MSLFGRATLVSMLLAGGGNAATAQAEPKADVILITIDTWRHDYWGRAGQGKVETPTLDGLARDGAWFESAYCQVPITPPSHATILTGLYPATHGIRDFTSGPLRPEVQTLATILKAKGYQTAAFVSAMVLDSVWGLDRGFDLYDDDFSHADNQGSAGNVQRRAEETLGRVSNWLSRQPPDGPPYFLWIHLFDPHHDYDPPQPFRTLYAADSYAGEVAYVDAQIGRLIGELKKRGEYDGSLIVATSDHGESLGEHGEPNHGLLLYEATIRIPLIVKLPSEFRIRDRRIPTVAETADILPTALQVLKVPLRPEWKVEGRGRLSAILGKDERRSRAYSESLYALSTFGWSPLYSYRDGRFKFIEAPQPELYDLGEDPEERQNLFPTRQAIGKRLREELQALRSHFEGGPDTTPPQPDSETVERLSALGYAALSRPVRVDVDRGLADPKDMLEVYRQIVEALDASEAGRLDRANTLLQKVAQSHPELFIVHYSMGLNELKMGRPQAALEHLDRARQLNPDYGSIDLNRAKALGAMGRPGEAISVLRELLERQADFPAARLQLAGLLRQSGEAAQAVEAFQSLLKKRPEDWAARRGLGFALIDAQRFEEGLRALDEASQGQPADALTCNYRGIALANLDRVEEAVSAYRQALDLKPDYGQARLNLAFALLRLGQAAEARQEYRLLCQTHPALCNRYRQQFENR